MKPMAGQAAVIAELPAEPGRSALNRSARSETVYVGLAALIVVGGYVDAWAHRHLASSLETFFTPWHGLLYGAALATGAWLGLEILAARRTLGSWRVAIPTGYELAVVGFGLVLVGGVGDVVWHTLFGIERSVDALLSPTHLVLAAGFFLVVTAPARAWLGRSQAADRLVPPAAIAAVVLGVAALAFITQFVNPFADYWPTDNRGASLTIGIAAIVIQSGILAGGVVALSWLGPIRPGSILLLFAGPAVLAAGAADTWFALPAAVTAAVVAEILTAGGGGRLAGSRLRWTVAIGLAVLWATYEAVLGAAYGLVWSAHAIGGAVLIGSVSGWLVAWLATGRIIGVSGGAAGPGPSAEPSIEGSRPIGSRMSREAADREIER